SQPERLRPRQRRSCRRAPRDLRGRTRGRRARAAPARKDLVRLPLGRRRPARGLLRRPRDGRKRAARRGEGFARRGLERRFAVFILSFFASFLFLASSEAFDASASSALRTFFISSSASPLTLGNLRSSCSSVFAIVAATTR